MAWLAESLQWHSCLIKSFVYICDGLVLIHRHILKPPNVKCNIFFRNYADEFPLTFSHQIFLKCYRKNCVELKIMEKNCTENFKDNSRN